MFCHGWFQVAYEHELDKELNSVEIGDIRLVLVRQNEAIRTFSANCPHRGAHLAHGGKVDGKAIICPFHAYRIGLGVTSQHGFQVQEYSTLTIGGLIFVRLSERFDNGFSKYIQRIAETHTIVPGFKLHVKAPPELIIENGFDSRHFPAVHRILNDPRFTVRPGEEGELFVDSILEVPVPGRPGTQPQKSKVPYLARTYSPGLIVVELNDERPYKVLTGAQPLADGTSIARLSVLLDKNVHGDTPNSTYCDYLLKYSRMAMEDDQVMWENLMPNFRPRFTAQDDAVLEFHRYCQQFEGE